jgi:acyl-CoA hydrolase/RimJ/RimL family protein N-acetyltransferase
MKSNWEKKIVSPAEVMTKIRPGMSIFIGSGMAEPRTLVKYLTESYDGNLQDLDLIQLVSLGNTVSFDERNAGKYRLKTFYPGPRASEAITAGLADMIPSRCYHIPRLFKSKAIPVDVALIQITPPDDAGYSSLGAGIDVVRYAIENASLVVGEICDDIPWTYGDTLVHMEDIDCLINSTCSPFYLGRWKTDDVADKIAANIAATIEDGSCLSFSVGPLFEALVKHLASRRHLGIHTPFFTDSLMDLVKIGAVTNRHKAFHRGKSLTSLALGTRDLMKWLDRNPLVEFQPVDIVMDPQNIGMNEKHTAIMPARKLDITGNAILKMGVGNVNAGTGAIQELFAGSSLSHKGKTIIALPSRNREGEPNILTSLEGIPYQFSSREFPDLVVTEHGRASLTGRTMRERAQALIDIAHPDDRAELIHKAKHAGVLYSDQICIAETGHLYPDDIACSHCFTGDLLVQFRAIKPSDEDNMRRLFYRFSDRAVYSRYHRLVKTMPHTKMQEYVNVDYRTIMSIVGLVAEGGIERIIAEARYVKLTDHSYADTACFVDESYQGKGIATFLLNLLAQFAKESGIESFTADILTSNKPMLRIINDKIGIPAKGTMIDGVYEITIPLKGLNTENRP